MKNILFPVLGLVLALGLALPMAAGANAVPDVVVTTDIISGPDPVTVGVEATWEIEITVEVSGGDAEDVVVQDGMGADLDDIALVSATAGTVTIGKKTVGQGKHKMRATMVTWDVGDLSDGATETLVVSVTTGVNPQGKQEFTSPDLEHELDGGASATYWYEDTEYESLETAPVSVEVIEVL